MNYANNLLRKCSSKDNRANSAFNNYDEILERVKSIYLERYGTYYVLADFTNNLVRYFCTYRFFCNGIDEDTKKYTTKSHALQDLKAYIETELSKLPDDILKVNLEFIPDGYNLNANCKLDLVYSKSTEPETQEIINSIKVVGVE